MLWKLAAFAEDVWPAVEAGGSALALLFGKKPFW